MPTVERGVPRRTRYARCLGRGVRSAAPPGGSLRPAERIARSHPAENRRDATVVASSRRPRFGRCGERPRSNERLRRTNGESNVEFEFVRRLVLSSPGVRRASGPPVPLSFSDFPERRPEGGRSGFGERSIAEAFRGDSNGGGRRGASKRGRSGETLAQSSLVRVIRGDRHYPIRSSPRPSSSTRTSCTVGLYRRRAEYRPRIPHNFPLCAGTIRIATLSPFER